MDEQFVGELESVTGSGSNEVVQAVLAEYDYDANGMRVVRKAGALSKQCIYGADGPLLAEFGGTAVAGTRYVVSDHLGSTRMVLTDTATCLSRMDYAPFGAQVTRSTATWPCYVDATDTDQKFTGQAHDAETAAGTMPGLDYFGARYFSGAQGRFTSPDVPLLDQGPSDPQSWNLYSYVRNNPLKFIDPTGNDCVYVNSAGNGIDSVNNQNTSKDCGKTGGYWVDGTVTDVRFAHGGVHLTGTTDGSDRTSSSYGLGPDPGLMALSQAGQLASPVTDPRFIAGFYGASALAGGALYLGGAFAGGELTTLGVSGGVDTILGKNAAGSIIGWGTGQTPAGVSATQSVTQGLTKAAVETMKKQGLNRITVEKLIQAYEQALSNSAQTGIRNDQLVPRLN